MLKLRIVAEVVLVLWLLRNFVHYFLPTGGLGGLGAFIGASLFDIRVWLLVIGVLVLYLREKKSPGPVR